MICLKFLLVANILAIGLSSATPLVHSDQVDNKIVGGVITTIEQNPWQVGVLNFGSQGCGGSIIGNKWVLSAAHCHGDAVRVGSSYHSKDGQIVGIKSFIRHEKFPISPEVPLDYDFALLELEESLNFTDKIQSIALPETDTEITDGTMTLVTGWGDTMNSSEPASQLRAVHLPIANFEFCREQYEKKNFSIQVTPRMICAGFEDGKKSPCYGDSGGPLTEYESGFPRLIGVVSWGLDCGAPNYPGVFSRVTSVRSWIRDLTGI